jgi:type IV pilus assembly protein PilA
MITNVTAFRGNLGLRPGKNTSNRFERGQGMTEYIIIVALIAVAAIAVYQLFGQVVRSQTAAIAHEVAGVSGASSLATAAAAAGLTDAQRTKKGLDTYANSAATAGAP